MRRTCSNHDQTLLTPCSNQILIKVNYIGRSPGLPATVFKPYLITEIWRCPGLLESIINQIQYVQTCVCVNVGRGAGLPETMFLLCLITELGHGPSLLEEVAHTRTHALTHLHFHRNQHQHLHLHLYSHLHLHLHLESGGSYNVESVVRKLRN